MTAFEAYVTIDGVEVAVAVVFWVVLPAIVGQVVGNRKNRAGWVWGLLLGWIGVAIVAVLRPKPEWSLEQLERSRTNLDPRYDQEK